MYLFMFISVIASPNHSCCSTTWVHFNIKKTSYCKISWSLEAAIFVFRVVRSLWHLAGTSAALLPTCLLNFKEMRIFNLPISWPRDFTRSYDKTSYRILKRDPDSWNLAAAKCHALCIRLTGHDNLFVCFIKKSFRTYSFFSPTPALSTISRTLSSSMCSITPETANAGRSYSRMRGPGIDCWVSDHSNCSRRSLTLTFTLTSENLSLYTTLLHLLVLIQPSWLQLLSC